MAGETPSFKQCLPLDRNVTARRCRRCRNCLSIVMHGHRVVSAGETVSLSLSPSRAPRFRLRGSPGAGAAADSVEGSVRDMIQVRYGPPRRVRVRVARSTTLRAVLPQWPSPPLARANPSPYHRQVPGLSASERPSHIQSESDPQANLHPMRIKSRSSPCSESPGPHGPDPLPRFGGLGWWAPPLSHRPLSHCVSR